MSGTTLTLELHNRKQAWFVIKEQAYPFIANWMEVGKSLVMTISFRKRTKPQNRRYWGKGVLAQIAAQATVNGRLYAAETWHEQFKRQFIGVIELPNGEVQGMSSADLSTADFCDFCTQVEAYASTELGVVFYELERATA